MNPDDPLDRLAADKDWRRRGREIDRNLAKLVRRERRRQRRPLRIGTGASGIRAGRSVSWIFLALLTVTVAGGIALWAGAGPTAPAVFVFVLADWLVTLCLHESPTRWWRTGAVTTQSPASTTSAWTRAGTDIQS